MRASTRPPTITPSETLIDPHPLVRNTMKAFPKSVWRAPKGERFPNPVRPKSDNEHLDLSVGPESFDRALRIMDALIKALEARGWSMVINEQKSDSYYGRPASISFETNAFVKEVPLRIRISEGSRREELPKSDKWFSPPWRRVDSGELKFEIVDIYEGASRRSWRDGKIQRLETMLDAIVVGLEENAGMALRAEEAAHRRMAEAERRKRVAAEEAERQRREEERRKILAEESERWGKVQALRDYVARLREMIVKVDGPVPHGSHNEERFRWAEAFIDSNDPVLAHEKRVQARIAERDASAAPETEAPAAPEPVQSGQRDVCECCARLCHRLHARDHHACVGYEWEKRTEALLTVPELAKKLRACDASVYKLVADGALPHVRVAGKILIHRNDLEAYVATARDAQPRTTVDRKRNSASGSA